MTAWQRYTHTHSSYGSYSITQRYTCRLISALVMLDDDMIGYDMMMHSLKLLLYVSDNI